MSPPHVHAHLGTLHFGGRLLWTVGDLHTIQLPCGLIISTTTLITNPLDTAAQPVHSSLP